MYYGRKSEDGLQKQPLIDHIEGVRRRAVQSAPENLKATAELIAVFHDAGKATSAWQDYLLNGGKQVSHSLTGMAILDEMIDSKRFEGTEDRYRQLLRDITAYTVGAHHSIYDALNCDGRAVILSKIDEIRQRGDIDEAKEFLFSEFSKEHIEKLIENALKEMEDIFKMIIPLGRFQLSSNKEELPQQQIHFTVHFIVRMLLSVIIDSDWSDAGAFFDDTEQIWEKRMNEFSMEDFSESLENFVYGFHADTDINRIRGEISEECCEHGEYPTGIYRLDVPTGGGKTLAVMRFALKHSIKYDKKRIFYCAPFKSILDQNAEVYRGIFQSEDYILEHHSDVIMEEEDIEEGGYENEQLKMYRYLIDNWDAPMILTTMVQFLNTLFSSNKHSLRRFHQLYRSVIIVDEFQSIPTKSISMFNLAINVLSKIFDATVILCTATQPPFDRDLGREGCEIPKIFYSEPKDLVTSYENEPAFLRATIEDKTRKTPYSPEEIADMIEKRMETERSLLVVLNTRAAVRTLYDLLDSRGVTYSHFFLSNDYVPEHRKTVLNDIKESLQTEKTLVISTPLIEAGVDLSFSGVIRSVTGLDSIVQALGRCNRHGEMERGELWIINPDDWENTGRMPEVRHSKDAMYPVLHDFSERPKQYEGSLTSHLSLEQYFYNYYHNYPEFTHYYCKDDGKDIPLVELLSADHGRIKTRSVKIAEGTISQSETNQTLNQAFKTAWDIYRPLEDDFGVSVLVEWGQGKEIALRLNGKCSFMDEKSLIRKMSRYSVKISKTQYDKLLEEGGIYLIRDEIPVLKATHYGETGFKMEPTHMDLIF